MKLVVWVSFDERVTTNLVLRERLTYQHILEIQTYQTDIKRY